LLTYLKDSPLNTFKIDQAFVGGVESQQTSALVSSIIAIGRHMGLELVAEGVETQQQFENLKQMGCKIFQGYLFGRPMPEVELIQWSKDGRLS